MQQCPYTGQLDTLKSKIVGLFYLKVTFLTFFLTFKEFLNLEN